MDEEAGWWTTSGNIGLPPLARVIGAGRQQQDLRETPPQLHEGGVGRQQQDLRESLQSVMSCSVARGPRLFKWKMPRESGPYALLFLQLLIALVTWSQVNYSASSRDIRFTSFDT